MLFTSDKFLKVVKLICCCTFCSDDPTSHSDKDVSFIAARRMAEFDSYFISILPTLENNGMDLLDALCGFIEKLSFDHLMAMEWDALDQILKSNIDLYQRRNGDVPTKISMISFLYLYELSTFITSNTLTIILQLCRKTTPNCGRPNKPLK